MREEAESSSNRDTTEFIFGRFFSSIFPQGVDRMKTVRMYDGKVFGHEVSDYAKGKEYENDS